MAEVIKMPRLSDTMEDGKIEVWHKKVGDKIAYGDVIAEIETDKAVQEFESDVDGVLLHIGVQEGEAVPVDSLMAIIGEEGEDISDLIDSDNTSSKDKSEEKSNTDNKEESDKSESKTEKESESKSEKESEKSNEIPEGVHIVTMPDRKSVV